MTTYVDTAAFKTYAGIPPSTTQWDALLAVVTASTYAAINRYCGRVFAGATTATSSRVFQATDFYCLEVDDIATSAGLVIATDQGNDTTYETTWASTDYELNPLNGLLDGQSWPYTRIRAVGSQTFPITYVNQRAHVQVTASWGWPSVPSEVTQAAYILCLDLFKLKDSPFGVAGTTEYGVMRIRENSQLAMLLKAFCRDKVMLG